MLEETSTAGALHRKAKVCRMQSHALSRFRTPQLCGADLCLGAPAPRPSCTQAGPTCWESTCSWAGTAARAFKSRRAPIRLECVRSRALGVVRCSAMVTASVVHAHGSVLWRTNGGCEGGSLGIEAAKRSADEREVRAIARRFARLVEVKIFERRVPDPDLCGGKTAQMQCCAL